MGSVVTGKLLGPYSPVSHRVLCSAEQHLLVIPSLIYVHLALTRAWIFFSSGSHLVEQATLGYQGPIGFITAPQAL